MKRRNFLRSIGAVSLMPLISAPLKAVGMGAVSQAPYSRYVYGLGVFHARTKASITAADLATKLAISQTQAHAMMGEILSNNVIRQSATPHIAHAVSQHMKPQRQIDLKTLHDQFMDLTESEPIEQDAAESEKINENHNEPLA